MFWFKRGKENKSRIIYISTYVPSILRKEFLNFWKQNLFSYFSFKMNSTRVSVKRMIVDVLHTITGKLYRIHNVENCCSNEAHSWSFNNYAEIKIIVIIFYNKRILSIWDVMFIGVRIVAPNLNNVQMRSKHVEYMDLTIFSTNFDTVFIPKSGRMTSSSALKVTWPVPLSVHDVIYHFPQSTVEDKINMADDF